MTLDQFPFGARPGEFLVLGKTPMEGGRGRGLGSIDAVHPVRLGREESRQNTLAA